MSITFPATIERVFDQSFNPRDPAVPRVHNKHRRTAPRDAVFIGHGSPWGNPFWIGEDGTREDVIEKHLIRILPYRDVSPLRGKHLVCFCKPAACHGDHLLLAANSDDYLALTNAIDRTHWLMRALKRELA